MPGPITLIDDGWICGLRRRRDHGAIRAGLPCLLDQRVSAITTELESGTDLNAHVALLSLESASTMVGATELAKLVALLRSEVERGQRTHIPGLVKAITNEATQLRGRLDPAET